MMIKRGALKMPVTGLPVKLLLVMNTPVMTLPVKDNASERYIPYMVLILNLIPVKISLRIFCTKDLFSSELLSTPYIFYENF